MSDPYSSDPYSSRSRPSPYGTPTGPDGLVPGGYPPAPSPYGLPSGDGLDLPPGVELASRGRRVGAYFLAIPLALVTLGIGYFIWGLVVWGRGTSPALQVLGMRTWKPAERRPGDFGTMTMKFGLEWVISFVTCGISSLVSFILFLSDDRRRTLGDRMAGSVVVHDPRKVL